MLKMISFDGGRVRKSKMEEGIYLLPNVQPQQMRVQRKFHENITSGLCHASPWYRAKPRWQWRRQKNLNGKTQIRSTTRLDSGFDFYM